MDTSDRLKQIASLLIDQTRARVIVPPQRHSTGHWFGGGNMVEDRDGSLWLVGRYRNQGDSPPAWVRASVVWSWPFFVQPTTVRPLKKRLVLPSPI